MHVVTRATTLTAFRDAAPAADVVLPAAAACREAGRDATHDLNLRIHGDLANVEAEWRRFEAVADCTVFQTFDWLAAWHRHIGLRARVRGAVVLRMDVARSREGFRWICSMSDVSRRRF